MPNVTNAEIEKLNEETEHTRQQLEIQTMQLGRLACAWKTESLCEKGASTYRLLRSAVAEKSQAEDEILTVRGAVARIDASRRELESAMNSISDLDRKKTQLLSALGAIAAEASNAGRLPERMKGYLGKVHEIERELQTGDDKGFFAKLKLGGLRKKLDSAYCDAGTQILVSGRAEMVPGEKAAAVLSEIRKITDTKEDVTQSMGIQQSLMFKAKDSLEEVGAYGSEEGHLKALETKLGKLDEKIGTLQAAYGRILGEDMSWLPPDAPADIATCCQEIARLDAKLSAQVCDMESLSTAKAMTIHREQAESLAERIDHLNTQIAQIEAQRDSFARRLAEENAIMDTLRARQAELNRKSLELRNR